MALVLSSSNCQDAVDEAFVSFGLGGGFSESSVVHEAVTAVFRLQGLPEVLETWSLALVGDCRLIAVLLKALDILIVEAVAEKLW